MILIACPVWEDLSVAMRTAIIHVYSAGRQLGAEEETASENNRVASGKTRTVAEGKGKS